jgi:hypothetical protein
MPILAASCIGRLAERYAESVFAEMGLNVISMTCLRHQNRQNAFLSCLKVHRFTLLASHKHSKGASNSPHLSFLSLHFILPMALASIETLLWRKRTLCCGKSLPYLEADLPISTLGYCTKPFEQIGGNALSASRQKYHRKKDTLLGFDWHEARQQHFTICFHTLAY